MTESLTSSEMWNAVVRATMLHPDVQAKQNFEFEDPTEIGFSFQLVHGERKLSISRSHPMDVGDWVAQFGEVFINSLFPDHCEERPPEPCLVGGRNHGIIRFFQNAYHPTLVLDFTEMETE